MHSPLSGNRRGRAAVRQGSSSVPVPRLNPAVRDEALPRLVATTATMALLVLGGRLLLALPGTPLPEAEESRIQLRFSTRPRTVGVLPPPPDATVAAPHTGVHATALAGPATAAPAASASSAAAPAAPAPLALYDGQGRIQLPVGAVPQSPTTRRERDPLEPANPVDYRGTRFEDAWISDGDAADVAQQELRRAQQKVAEVLFGKDVQHARARPSPEVRFNPARHERPSDLGSEATGDAWRAAPISYEPAPGLGGEASRRIRERVAALEREHAGCDRQRLATLVAPVRQSLDELQRVEYAYAHGADPVRAQHQLPATANGAWDQARRALWYAEQQLADCRS